MTVGLEGKWKRGMDAAEWVAVEVVVEEKCCLYSVSHSFHTAGSLSVVSGLLVDLLN